MKISIIYDNNAKENLEADWGFACLIENDKKILFDTGANGLILLENMEKMNIDPEKIDEVFISHPHFDHTGGLSSFLNSNQKAKIYIPISMHGIKSREVAKIKESREIHENIYSTGQLNGIEQSLVINTNKGLVIIVGCSHPGVDRIMDKAKQLTGKENTNTNIHAIIGGFHGFNELEKLQEVDIIAACHCTQHKKDIRSKFPNSYKEIKAGSVIEI